MGGRSVFRVSGLVLSLALGLGRVTGFAILTNSKTAKLSLKSDSPGGGEGKVLDVVDYTTCLGVK